jgi:hypothetical protein
MKFLEIINQKGNDFFSFLNFLAETTVEEKREINYKVA